MSRLKHKLRIDLEKFIEFLHCGISGRLSPANSTFAWKVYDKLVICDTNCLVRQMLNLFQIKLYLPSWKIVN